MAMFLAGLGSVIAQEIGKVAVEHMPLVKQVATDTATTIAKQAFDTFLDHNPKFASVLGIFGVRHFNERKTMSHRGRHRRIAM
jgi:hypothetical protein